MNELKCQKKGTILHKLVSNRQRNQSQREVRVHLGEIKAP